MRLGAGFENVTIILSSANLGSKTIIGKSLAIVAVRKSSLKDLSFVAKDRITSYRQSRGFKCRVLCTD